MNNEKLKSDLRNWAPQGVNRCKTEDEVTHIFKAAKSLQFKEKTKGWKTIWTNKDGKNIPSEHFLKGVSENQLLEALQEIRLENIGQHKSVMVKDNPKSQKPTPKPKRKLKEGSHIIKKLKDKQLSAQPIIAQLKNRYSYALYFLIFARCLYKQQTNITMTKTYIKDHTIIKNYRDLKKAVDELTELGLIEYVAGDKHNPSTYIFL